MNLNNKMIQIASDCDDQVFVLSTLGQGPKGEKGDTGDARFPTFADPIEWDINRKYDEFTLVLNDGKTYISRQAVPLGTSISNGNYWALANDYDAQVTDIAQRLVSVRGDVDGLQASLPDGSFDSNHTVKGYIDQKDSDMKTYVDGEIDDTNDSIDNLRDTMEDDYVPFPDSPNSKYGTANQVLSTLTNGKTQWVNPVNPSDAQAETYITAWLNDHPEATTTVQDNSLDGSLKLIDDSVPDSKLAQSGGILSAFADYQKNVCEMNVYSGNSGDALIYPFKFYSGLTYRFTYNSPNSGGYCGLKSMSDSVTVVEDITVISSGYYDWTPTYDAPYLRVYYANQPATLKVEGLFGKLFEVEEEIADANSDIKSLYSTTYTEQYGYVYSGDGTIRTHTTLKYTQIPVIENERYFIENIVYELGTGWSVMDVNDNVLTYGAYENDQTSLDITIPYGGKKLNLTIKHTTLVVDLFRTFKNAETYTNEAIKGSSQSYMPFVSFGIIGDSLADGVSNFTGGSVEQPVFSWGKNMQREHGITANLFARGGHTTRSWIQDTTGVYNGIGAMLDCDPCDIYIIGLGVNDMASLGSGYLGSVSDVHVGNEELNADTYYGNYSKIIASILGHAPKTTIVAITMPNTAGGTPALRPDFVQAIKTVCALYSNVYVYDAYNDNWYNQKPLTTTRKEGHYSPVGYALIASHLWETINEMVKDNMTYFKDVCIYSS